MLVQAMSDGGVRDTKTKGFQRLGLDVFLILRQ
jgi:hypothetical protein